MSSGLEKVVFSRDISDSEFFTVSLFLEGLLKRNKEDDQYYYVDVKEDLDLTITGYRAEEVQWQAKELMCTDLQALFSIVDYDGFYEELMDTLWANKINGLTRFVAQTKTTLIKDQEPHYCIAKNEKEALYYFKTILQLKDVLTVREDDEEIFG